MSEVLSIRIPRRLKREIEELKDIMNLKEEIIEFLEKRVKMYKKMKILKEAHKILEKHPIIPAGTAVKIVREDRDRH